MTDIEVALNIELSSIPDDYSPRLIWSLDRVVAHDDVADVTLAILLSDMTQIERAVLCIQHLRRALWQANVLARDRERRKLAVA